MPSGQNMSHGANFFNAPILHTTNSITITRSNVPFCVSSDYVTTGVTLNLLMIQKNIL